MGFGNFSKNEPIFGPKARQKRGSIFGKQGGGICPRVISHGFFLEPPWNRSRALDGMVPTLSKKKIRKTKNSFFSLSL